MHRERERRRQKRISAEYRCVADSDGKKLIFVSRDATPFGMGVYSNTALKPGDRVDLKIMIPTFGMHIQAKGEVVYCIDNPYRNEKDQEKLIGISFTEGPLEEMSLADPGKARSRYTPSHTLSIDAAPKLCYKLLADFERYPEWAGGVEEARVIERYPDGRGRRVEFLHDFFLRKVRYVLDYSYDDEKSVLSWVSAGADDEIVGITGSYVFQAGGADKSVATYKLDVTLSVIPSKRLVNFITNILMRREMKNFKKFVEKNAK